MLSNGMFVDNCRSSSFRHEWLSVFAEKEKSRCGCNQRTEVRNERKSKRINR